MQTKRTNRTRIGAVALVLAMMASMLLGAVAIAADPVPLHSSHVGTTNSGFTPVGTCPTPPAGQEGWWGWHFIMPGNNNFTSLSVTFQNAGTFSADPFPGGAFVAHPDNSHAYIWTPTDDTLLAGSATSDGKNTFFNLSHVCPGTTDYEELTVTKSAHTTFTREHFWDIAKKVETEKGAEHEGFPKVWLFIDGSGNESATWTVDVTYQGYTDSGWNVSGDITIENTGSLDAVITAVDDVLAGAPIDVDCGVEFPYTLPVGETLTCTYSEDGYVEGFNEVTVKTERDEYCDDAEIVWGDPTTEINKTVTVNDISDLFGEKELGTVTAPDNAQFTYEKSFEWADYGQAHCGDYSYGNTATIVETGQSASAMLKVNVQCYVYETAFAKGNGAHCFIPDFSRWGWTNPIAPGTHTMELWAAAGQCDTSKGTLVGSVTVHYNGGFDVIYNVDPPYLLEETHVYAGGTKYPMIRQGKNLVPTVAPGQYYIASPYNYVIAHAVVGLPDPKFGPDAKLTVESHNSTLFLPTVTR